MNREECELICGMCCCCCCGVLCADRQAKDTPKVMDTNALRQTLRMLGLVHDAPALQLVLEALGCAVTGVVKLQPWCDALMTQCPGYQPPAGAAPVPNPAGEAGEKMLKRITRVCVGVIRVDEKCCALMCVTCCATDHFGRLHVQTQRSLCCMLSLP